MTISGFGDEYDCWRQNASREYSNSFTHHSCSVSRVIDNLDHAIVHS